MVENLFLGAVALIVGWAVAGLILNRGGTFLLFSCETTVRPQPLRRMLALLTLLLFHLSHRIDPEWLDILFLSCSGVHRKGVYIYYAARHLASDLLWEYKR